MLAIERWLALYLVVGDHVQVVRIVNGARDLGASNGQFDRGMLNDFEGL